MDFNQFDANWNYPTTIQSGIGRIKELPLACKELGMKAPLLITDPGLADTPMVQEALENCRREGLRCEVFSGIKSNPSGENVTDGVSAYWQGEHDGVIAFGGGSALDAAKAVALMVGQDRPLWDFEDIGDNWTRVRSETMAPLVAVPTTSGTGSEVGRASVITDEAQQIKRIIFHPKMLPAIVILDAKLTTGLPEKLTAATGMDALSHALEAYCAPYFHPMAEGIALEAIRLVKNYLPRATADGNDIEARAQMMVASTMGATAFQRGLGGMHALAHPLGAVYDSHHGLLNAILMPYVLKANRSAIESRIERLARYLELPDSSFDGFINWILALREQLNIPHALSDIGIDATRVSDIGEMAQNDPSAGGNPIPFTAQEYTDICLSAINGTF
ncbi:iron-containing alcohol dehydrogenase [Thalassomonas haliotis]|uniref:Iron-containing alcohol dehydrogenase n=1 Tax=Thalassomonas haliotis TaxID=485448 RepID=A0ABY7V7W9_9GAMM|nr:iron-containing alcohol dehydrogenase [Thalassomonas haliotis]WDE09734.1 iron-containing alcohol dehydrogenase [Thalassomonas haliotis]